MVSSSRVLTLAASPMGSLRLALRLTASITRLELVHDDPFNALVSTWVRMGRV